MFTFENSIFINCPQQEVFDYVSNPANSHRFQSGTVSAEWISKGPPGVGSTHRSVTRSMGRDIESTVEYIAWVPPSQFSWRVVSGPIPAEGTSRFESENGGTKYTMSGKIEVGGVFKLAEGLVKKQLQKQHEADLSVLKQLLEEG